MTYDRYAYECGGDNETTTDQAYLRHIRMELQNVTAATDTLTRVIAERIPLPEIATTSDEQDQDSDIDDEPPPDYSPPGSGSAIVKWP